MQPAVYNPVTPKVKDVQGSRHLPFRTGDPETIFVLIQFASTLNTTNVYMHSVLGPLFSTWFSLAYKSSVA